MYEVLLITLPFFAIIFLGTFFHFKNFFDNNLSTTDPDVFNSIKLELERQQQHIELIASENIVSKAVLYAQGSIMTNKYAEGYPAKRYYGGCDFVDKAEDLALERVKKLFDFLRLKNFQILNYFLAVVF